jgi:hypothetical protein
MLARSRTSIPPTRPCSGVRYNYTPDKDVARLPMQVETLPHSAEQLSWEFVDVTDAGGSMAISWDKNYASAPFTVGK